MKILILGGYGVFGGRLAHLLADLAELELLICGRHLKKAEAFCAHYQGAAQVTPLALDRSNIAEALQTHTPHLVVDASGPFQAYGHDPYLVIKACIAAKVDYLDFSDAADFVFAVDQFNATAEQAGVFILSGASSFPVLSAAVLRQIAKHIEIVNVEGGIAPSPFAGIGLNVMRAVVSYAGAPVKLWRNGQAGHGIGLAESRRFTIAVPGHLPLRNIHFSLVDVPDLQVLPRDYPKLQNFWMGAGPVPELLHRALNLLAKIRARWHLPSFEPLAPLFYRVLNLMRFGEHRGGMLIRATGLADGIPRQISWHLIAEGDDGPFIPSMTIEAIIRNSLQGIRPALGARPATHELELCDYDKLFQSKRIVTGIRTEPATGSLYQQLLGEAFAQLPPRLQELHGSPQNRTWHGSAQVQRGKGILAKLIAKLMGFPNEGANVPLSVSFHVAPHQECWQRTFAGKTFTSVQSLGTGKDQYLLLERFGIMSFALALEYKDQRLYLTPRKWRLLGIPMPRFLLPNGVSFESQEHDQFCFQVEIAAPMIGLIVAYKGSLAAQQQEQPYPHNE